MTEESSADEDGPEPADGEQEPAEEDRERADENDLAPARSEEEPDVEAAREELAAVGRTEDEGEGEDEEGEEGGGDVEEGGESADSEADGQNADDEEEVGADEDTGEGVDDDGDEAEDEGSEGPEAADDPQPEDLVRDPDEPQVTSSLEEAEAADAAAETDAAEPDAGAAGADGQSVEAPGEASGAAAEASDGEGVSESSGAEPSTEDAEAADQGPESGSTGDEDADQQAHQPGVPDDVQKYDRFKKVDGSQYDRVNEFLRDRTYITAREWAIARLCSDFRTETGVEMTKIGENLPELVPFMTDTYTPQAVNQARSSFEDKVRTAGATFLYGAMCDFFTAEELDDVMYEATEVAKFLLEVEGVELSVEDELEAEDRISAVMREVRSSSAELRHERCPECGAELTGGEH